MEKIKFAVIGVGRLGTCHAENLVHRIPNAELVTICDIRLDHAKETAERLGVEKVYESYDKMLAEMDIDAVVVTTPPAVHRECILAACKAKKHIFCEKPIGVTDEDLDLIDAAVAENADKVLQVGFMRRFDRSYADAKARVDRGEIGKVIKVRSISRDPSAQMDDFIKLGPTLGGMFYDMSVHDLDLVRWFAGSEIESMYAIGGIYEFEDFASFNDIDNCAMLMRFKNGVMGEVEGSKNASCGYDVWMEIVGTKGTLLINSATTTFVTQKDEHGIRNECSPWFRERFAEAYQQEVKVFIDTVLTGGETAMSAYDARKVVEMATLATKSYELGTVVYNEK